MTGRDEYRTSDFGAAVFLLCNDMALSGASRVGERRVEFAFAGRAQCEGLVAGMVYNDRVPLSRALHEIRRARAVIRQTE
jgi:hypothetical protein